MSLQTIRTYNFRNLRDAVVSTRARDVFLVGENGQGKTNFLEAIYYICYASSFRTRKDEVLRRNGETEMAVAGVYDADEEDHQITVKQSGKTKSITLDGREVRDRREIVTTIPCIVFCHDDIQFVTGPPESRRWFMNQTLSLLDRSTLDETRLYTRILKMRNAVLKEGRTDMLDVLDLQLAQAGVPIVQRRAKIVELMNATLSLLFATVFESELLLEIGYRATWDRKSQAEVIDVLRQCREQDLDLKTSTRGPHRDRFPMRLGGKPLTEVASTGQLRLVSLLLRVAQAQLLAAQRGTSPILLLDDVLLELDPRRRGRFVQVLPAYQQAFFTFLPDEQYARFRDDSTLTYRVEGGVIRAQD